MFYIKILPFFLDLVYFVVLGMYFLKDKQKCGVTMLVLLLSGKMCEKLILLCMENSQDYKF